MKKLGLLFFCFLYYGCSGEAQQKINGVSFVASREEATQKNIDDVLAVHANSAAVMPFGFMRSVAAPEVVFDTDRQWFGETKAGAKQYIHSLHKNNVAVLLKPQIWIWKGEFTGVIAMKTEADWKTFETSYEQFILAFATLAQETNVAIFCIGTELENFVNKRPVFWRQLITKVRAIYKGKLTYAANWDEYTRTPFWNQLDYIGIDAYFPLSEAKTPTEAELQEGWQRWIPTMESVAGAHNKQVLFTEFGYRSMDFTAKKPWLVDRKEQGINMQGQVNATKAIFNEFWQKKWFAGGFVWKWFRDHQNAGGATDNRFTPQNKPAEAIIKKHFGNP